VKDVVAAQRLVANVQGDREQFQNGNSLGVPRSFL
jgi:hypothetical protein